MTASHHQRTVLLTGSSRGIGAAIAARLLADGHRVVGLARSYATSGAPSALAHQEPAMSQGGWTPAAGLADRFAPVPCDLGAVDILPDRLKAILQDDSLGPPERQGPLADTLDTVICNAGAGLFGSLEQLSPESISRSIALNVTSPLLLLRACLPHLKRRARAQADEEANPRSPHLAPPCRVILVGSVSALQGKRTGSVYCASKFAVRGMAQALRDECAASGVGVSVVNPGAVRTPFFASLDFAPGPDPDNAMPPEAVADLVAAALDLPAGAVVDEITATPLKAVWRKQRPTQP